MEQKKRIEVKIKSYDLPPDSSEKENTEHITAKTHVKAVARDVGTASQAEGKTEKKKFVVVINDDEYNGDPDEKIKDKNDSDNNAANTSAPPKNVYIDDTVSRIIAEADQIREHNTKQAGNGENPAEKADAAADNSSNTEEYPKQNKNAVHDKPAKTQNKKGSKKGSKKKNKYEPKNPVARFFKKFIPWAGDSAGEAIRKMILLVSGIVAIACIYIIVQYYSSGYDSKSKNQELADMHEQLEQQDGVASEPDEIYVSEDDSYIPPMLRSQQYYYDLNSDVIGWIEIENTHVDLPVLQADDNDYYLKKDIYKNDDEYGCIFLDYRCVLDHKNQSDNLVIYGHDTKTNYMFGDLDQYKPAFGTINFLKEHPVIKFNSNYYKSEYVIFAVVLTNAEEKDGEVWGYQNEIEFTDELDFQTFVSNAKKRSMYDTYIDVEYGEKMITLSTCASDFADSRLVIIARELREGETGYDYIDNYEYNDNPLYPDTWYYYRGGSYDDTDTRYDIETLYGTGAAE